MINPVKEFSINPSRLELTVFTFAYESPWCGLRAEPFLTQESAEAAWVAAITSNSQLRDELLALRGSDEAAFLEKMEELRDPMDTYCIHAHKLEVTTSLATPPADVESSHPTNRVVRFSGMQADWNRSGLDAV